MIAALEVTMSVRNKLNTRCIKKSSLAIVNKSFVNVKGTKRNQIGNFNSAEVYMKFSIAEVQTKVINCHSANKSCLLQIVHTKAIAALT